VPYEPEELADLRTQIADAAEADRAAFDEALADVRRLRSERRAIQPRDANYISLVASDGGHNHLEFNPFALQIVRVMDSYGRQILLDVAPARADLLAVGRRHLADGEPKSTLGRMMVDLGVETLPDLSPVLKANPDSASWFQVYREICEWAALYELVCHREHAGSVVVVHDGLLRSKVFKSDLFIQLYNRMQTAIEKTRTTYKRDIFVVGLAKRSQVVQHYQLAMAVEDLFPSGGPYYVPVPYEFQEKLYRWSEYIRPPDPEAAGELPKFNIGSMQLVRFGPSRGDPVWTVDLLASQVGRAQEIFGCLLADARNGFPIPFYPKCLQQADHFAQVTEFDRDILDDLFTEAVKKVVGEQGRTEVEALRLTTEAIGRRYG
jgi:hypothetical protein